MGRAHDMEDDETELTFQLSELLNFEIVGMNP